MRSNISHMVRGDCGMCVYFEFVSRRLRRLMQKYLQAFEYFMRYLDNYTVAASGALMTMKRNFAD